jgi:predicted metal-binding membrane protein
VPIASGVALVAAGIYQLTPWKAACLRHCRDPLSLVATHMSRGWRGALRLGVYHGAFCAACCWALMLIQLVLGVMNILVMITVALVIALEKLLPRGMVVARATGMLAMAVGAIIAGRALLT